MRLWTLHPRYLDRQGLVTLWREGLLARAVLRGETRGYRHHPQLRRFLAHATPCTAMNVYLAALWREACRRGYAFDRSKIGPVRRVALIPCTSGQLEYEWLHLLRKLRSRSTACYRACRVIERPEPHPLFRIVSGSIEEWERP